MKPAIQWSERPDPRAFNQFKKAERLNTIKKPKLYRRKPKPT